MKIDHISGSFTYLSALYLSFWKFYDSSPIWFLRSIPIFDIDRMLMEWTPMKKFMKSKKIIR